MTPFFFGTAARRLFGVYEPAASGGFGKRAAVLCYPWGAEYLYAHRSMRQLAIRLSVAGFHTLRFDFFGTGDSAGDMADADLAGWITDADMAVDEIKDIVGAARVTLIGLRLGATLAARVAARRPDDIDALVLWDPIVSGVDYLASIDAGPGSTQSEDGDAREVRGYPLTAAMKHDFQSIEPSALLASPAARTLMLVTEPARSAVSQPAAPEGHGKGSFAIEYMTALRPWIEDPDSIGVVPVGVIQRIVNWLG
jgi:pimeloyl-ACP methyl ester carboxylesterase